MNTQFIKEKIQMAHENMHTMFNIIINKTTR